MTDSNKPPIPAITGAHSSIGNDQFAVVVLLAAEPV